MQPPLFRNAEQMDEHIGRFLYGFRRVGQFNIHRVAASFADKFGLHTFPRDPRQHLPQFGILLEQVSLPRGVRAVWLRAGDCYTIRYSMHMAGRLGLVLWHEFFEMMSANPRFPSRLKTEEEERLATLFAVHLMMPEEAVRDQAARLGHPANVDKTRVLAARFGVSAGAMTIRLRELDLAPRDAAGRSSYY